MGISRQRAIPPDVFTDEDLIALPRDVRMTLVGLYLHADDEGRETATTWQIKGSVWPGDSDITEETIVEHLILLDDVGWVQLYDDGTRSLFSLPVFPTPSHPKRSKFPAPPPRPRRNGDGAETEDRSAGERERAGGESGPGEHPDGLPPSPFCRVHQPAGSGGKPCHHCQDARLAYTHWSELRRAAAREEAEA